jgi:hypothetical protein
LFIQQTYNETITTDIVNYKLQYGDSGNGKECGQKINVDNMVTMRMLRNLNTYITIKVNIVIKEVERFIYLFFEVKYSEGKVDG